MLETTVNVGATTSLNETEVIPENPVPVITTVLPCKPAVGVKEVSVGGTNTVKLLADVPVPAGVVTEILPVAAPAGTFTLI